MRVALVSPYSWTYPGGVTRHIEALRGELAAAGHHVRVLAPVRPRHARDRARPPRRPPAAARGARLADPARPDAGLGHERRRLEPRRLARAVARLRSELRAGRFDVVHVHEPVTPARRLGRADLHRAPLVGTFHCYSESRAPHAVANLFGARRRSTTSPSGSPSPRPRPGPAGASTAASTGSCPTACRCPPAASPRRGCASRASRCGSPSSARPSSARACPCCCAPSRRCASTCPRELTIVGASEPEVAPLLVDRTGVEILGRVSDEREARGARRAPTSSPPRRSAASRSAWS